MVKLTYPNLADFLANPGRDPTSCVNFGVDWSELGTDMPHWAVHVCDSSREMFAVANSGEYAGQVEILADEVDSDWFRAQFPDFLGLMLTPGSLMLLREILRDIRKIS